MVITKIRNVRGLKSQLPLHTLRKTKKWSYTYGIHLNLQFEQIIISFVVFNSIENITIPYKYIKLSAKKSKKLSNGC